EEMKNAEKVGAAKRLSGGRLYDEIVKDGKVETAQAAPAAPAAKPANGDGDGDDKTVYKVDPGSGPSKGAKNAPVQIVVFSDFQCPFGSRVVPTVKEIEQKYAGRVRITWRNYPLPFHDKAVPAAEAAMAAAEQGKFWEMHDKLFGNQQALDRATFDKYAEEL